VADFWGGAIPSLYRPPLVLALGNLVALDPTYGYNVQRGGGPVGSWAHWDGWWWRRAAGVPKENREIRLFLRLLFYFSVLSITNDSSPAAL